MFIFQIFFVIPCHLTKKKLNSKYKGNVLRGVNVKIQYFIDLNEGIYIALFYVLYKHMVLPR